MKNKIDTSRWKEFPYTDFFEMITNKKKLTNKDLSDHGNTPVYSSSTFANGFFGYTERLADYIITKENPMYLIFGDHTKSMFIVKENFSVMDNVKVFKTKIYNEYCLRFITTVWQKQIPNIGYARHWVIAKKIPIILPINNNGKPDWEYMEQYMKNIEKHVYKSLRGLKSENNKFKKINIIEWKEFEIGDLFDIHPTKAYKKNNSYLFEERGINPVVVNSCYNNGIGGYTNLSCTEDGNIITFSDTTSANSIFYQKRAFVGYPHVQGMYPIGEYKDKWNEYTYLFFITLFRKKAINLNYNYVNKFTRESARKIKIKLPIDNDGNPDWEYMERYMMNLLKDTRDNLDHFKSV